MIYPDPLPFKLRVLRAVTATLKTITPANGYFYDLSDDTDPDALHPTRVFRGRAWFGDNDPIPMLSVLEGVNPADEVAEPQRTNPKAAYEWPILIQGFVNDDPVHPTDPAYLLMADVRRRLAVERERKIPGSQSQSDPFGMGAAGPNRVVALDIGPGVVRPADDVSARAYFWLLITLTIVDDASQPYA